MADFMIRFLICNILLCGIIEIFLLMKHILKNNLSSRMQYNLWFLLLALWISCIIAMLILVIRSALRLHILRKSALPLQSQKIQRLYERCLCDTGIKKRIPIYSTAYLKSPVIVGFWKPCIYLPIHLISDDNETDIRYMLLHELQHYKHRDGIANYLMNLAETIYWFNPLVWYALKEMRSDREIACDTSVLKLLESEDNVAYGNTLINFAEKISLTPFPFASGISGNMKQMKRRILNIASYERPDLQKKLKSITAFLLISKESTSISYCAPQSSQRIINFPDKIISIVFSPVCII